MYSIDDINSNLDMAFAYLHGIGVEKGEKKAFEIFKKEITLKSSYINPYTYRRALDMIVSGKLDVSSMIYRTAELEELPGILADKKARGAGKYIIKL